MSTTDRSPTRKELIKNAAENNFEFFINLVHPQRLLGHLHKDLCSWMTREEAKTHQLILLPRDHMKSAIAAYYAAWCITRNPAIRILYISSTVNLANKQLRFIKDILTSDIYRLYWPEMINKEESKREKWTETEISVDHPLRKQEIIRDPTIFIAGLTTGIVGMHCDLAIMDDVVVDDNAKSADGRDKVKTQASYLASICAGDAKQLVVGTRYHPLDLYQDLMEAHYDTYDNNGNAIETHYLFETYERTVEDRGDGSGQFLWPRQQRGDGKWFGFDQTILARKKAQYYDQTKFRAQYYNNPNDISNASIRREMFQYYDPHHLKDYGNGWWEFNGRKINLHASVDFAFSLGAKADFTCITVVGVDNQHNYFVLDIERFRTTKISEYFEKILKLYTKWGFRKITCEVNVAQKVIVEDLKTNYIRAHGLALTVQEYRPTSNQGTKEERMQAVLQSKYENGQIFHYKGGNCELLEEELQQARPPHDDIKDSLSVSIENCTPPTGSFQGVGLQRPTRNSKGGSLREQYTHSRFGGIS